MRCRCCTGACLAAPAAAAADAAAAAAAAAPALTGQGCPSRRKQLAPHVVLAAGCSPSAVENACPCQPRLACARHCACTPLPCSSLCAAGVCLRLETRNNAECAGEPTRDAATGLLQMKAVWVLSLCAAPPRPPAPPAAPVGVPRCCCCRRHRCRCASCCFLLLAVAGILLAVVAASLMQAK